jgi:hypothetical protein
MKKAFSLALALMLAGTAAFAGAPTLSGDYVEVRSNHVLGGGCTYSAEADMDANQAVVAWRIRDGGLAGLAVVAVILGEGNLQLGHYGRETILFVDSKATAAQQESLKEAFVARYADLFGTVKKAETAEIVFRHEGGDAYEVVVPGQVQVATRTMAPMDHEPSCDRMVWYRPLSSDATATLVQTAQHAYSGRDLRATWDIPNKRSAYVGTFSFSPELAAR